MQAVSYPHLDVYKRQDKNLCSYLVSLIYRADTCTNVFPSIHVYHSICVHVALTKSRALQDRRLVRIGSEVLMVAIRCV